MESKDRVTDGVLTVAGGRSGHRANDGLMGR